MAPQTPSPSTNADICFSFIPLSLKKLLRLIPEFRQLVHRLSWLGSMLKLDLGQTLFSEVLIFREIFRPTPRHGLDAVQAKSCAVFLGMPSKREPGKIECGIADTLMLSINIPLILLGKFCKSAMSSGTRRASDGLIHPR